MEPRLQTLVVSGARPWGLDPCRDLHIREGRVASDSELVPDALSLAADGRIVLPGLINVHAHLDKVLLAERIENVSGTIAEARAKMKEAKASFAVSDVKQRAGKVLRRSVQDGISAIRTHVDVDPIVGLRGLEALLSLRDEMSPVLDLQIVVFPQEGIAEQPGTEDLMREALRMGADVVGGHLSIARDQQALKKQIDTVFRLATAFDKDIDVHVDFDVDRDYGREVSLHADGWEYPDGLGTVHLAERTIADGYQGRVAASHLCALDSLPQRLRMNVVDLILRANLAVIALPASNMYVHGRNDLTGTRRGITRLRELQSAGVRVAVGTDNIRDPFNPYVNTDLIGHAVFTALACHFVTSKDFLTVLRLHTEAAAGIMGLKSYGLGPGCVADLVVFEAHSLEDLLDGAQERRWVLKRGNLVAEADVRRHLYIDRDESNE